MREGATPILKKRFENEGSNENLSCGFPSISGVAPRVALRIVVFVFAQVVRCHSENGISHSENHFLNSDSCSENTPYHKAPPQKRSWTPPLMIRFPPPSLCSLPIILLRGNGHRPDKSHFLRPPKLVLEGALYSTFPPKKSHDTFCPPRLRFSKRTQTAEVQNRYRGSE